MAKKLSTADILKAARAQAEQGGESPLAALAGPAATEATALECTQTRFRDDPVDEVLIALLDCSATRLLISRGKQHLLGVAGFNLNRLVWTLA